MATYREIQSWVKKNYGWIPKTCWVAHCKELYGIPRRSKAPNRKGKDRAVPCPENKREAICKAFRHFNML